MRVQPSPTGGTYSLVFLETPLLWLQTRCHSDHTFTPVTLLSSSYPVPEHILSALSLLILFRVTITAHVDHGSGLSGLHASLPAPLQSLLTEVSRIIL